MLKDTRSKLYAKCLFDLWTDTIHWVILVKGKDSRLRNTFSIANSQKQASSSCSGSERHQDIVYRACGDSVGGVCPQTQTGRDTCILNKTRTEKQSKTSSQQLWKPALNTNCRRNHLALYPSLEDNGNYSTESTTTNTSSKKSIMVNEGLDEAAVTDSSDRPFANVWALIS